VNFSQLHLQNICGHNFNYDLVCGRKLALEAEIYCKYTMKNCRIFYKYAVGRLRCPLLSPDRPRYQVPDITKSYRTRRHRPGLRYSWPVQCYRTGTFPLMDIVHPSNDLRTGREIPLEPFRRYEGKSYLNMCSVWVIYANWQENYVDLIMGGLETFQVLVFT